MKKMISVLLVMLLMLGVPLTAAAAELTSCTVSADSVAAKAGETVTVPVRITDNPGFTNFAIKLDYDRENLTLVSLETTGGEEPYLCGTLASTNIAWTEKSETSYGYVTCASETEVTEDGILFAATFQVSENFSGTAVITPVINYMRNNMAFFSVFENIAVTSSNGSISTIVMGDTNGDGTITATDAAMIYRYINNALTLSQTQLSAADVNGDSTITATDAAMIYRYINNTITSFPNT